MGKSDTEYGKYIMKLTAVTTIILVVKIIFENTWLDMYGNYICYGLLVIILVLLFVEKKRIE